MVLAISIKQPWAALVVSGLKTIEVRRWPTRRRGPVLIHTGRMPDTRAESWTRLPDKLARCADQRGGILGEAQLVECRTYDSRNAFARDQHLHLNDPSWFQSPIMYGFVFAEANLLPFQRCSGSLYFFDVAEPAAPAIKASTGLLVSVRTAEEAAAALAGGADIIDVKEPRRGALGKAPDSVIAGVVRRVQGKRPVSAALGELVDFSDVRIPGGLSYIKFGLANMGQRSGWEKKLCALREKIARQPQAPKVVTVAYADWKRAGAPPWQDVAKFALRQPGEVLLVDTFDKQWRPVASQARAGSLLDWVKPRELRVLCQRCRDAGVRIALAGSLRLRQIVKLLDAKPTWFAVRGGVCESNKRDGEVHFLKVRDLAEVLRWKQCDSVPKVNPGHV